MSDRMLIFHINDNLMYPKKKKHQKHFAIYFSLEIFFAYLSQSLWVKSGICGTLSVRDKKGYFILKIQICCTLIFTYWFPF